MNLSFNNQVLRGKDWKDDVLYIDDRGNFIDGMLYLSTTSFTFRMPTDEQGCPSLRGKLSANSGTINIHGDVVELRAEKGLYRFKLSPTSVQSLFDWMKNKTEALGVTSRISNSFLGAYDAYPHPFIEAHKADNGRKAELLQYLGKCIPVLKKPVDWGIDDVIIQIDSEKTEICIGKWKYCEEKDQIKIDCQIHEAGFFDDSDSEMEFYYEIRYLGKGFPDKQCSQIENGKAEIYFKADKFAYPKRNGNENFVAENPFGLKGFYRIKWTLRYDW